MKILIATGIFPPDVGGPATYSLLLAQELSKRGHEVRVIAYADRSVIASGTPRGNPEGIASTDTPRNDTLLIERVLRTRFKPWNYFRFFQAVKKYGRQADVIYAQGPVSDGYPAYLASLVLKKPLVVKITGDYSWEQAMGRGLTEKLIDEFQSLADYPPQIKRMRGIQKAVCMHAQIIITPSEYLKKIVIGWGIKPDKIKVIYNAVEKPAVSSKRSAVRKKLGIAENTFLIVSSGRDVPWKGFDALRVAVQQLSNSMELDSVKIRLKILHSAPRSEFHEWIQAADVYVLNTGYEGLSNTLVEVLHLGTPIITTNVCGNPEIIKNEVNGLLVEYNNAEQLKEAILRIYSDARLRDQLRASATSSLGSQFTLKTMLSQTEELLAAVASRKN